jgi:carbon storage regulator
LHSEEVNSTTTTLHKDSRNKTCCFQGGSKMLVLTRKAGERIVIDDNIVVEVLEVQGNRVRIGIQAPQGVTILRQELLLGKNNPQTPPNRSGSNLAGVP